MANNAKSLTLDYYMCTPSELDDFIENRKTLTATESDALRTYHKSYLVGRLEHLDRNATFRFADLAPETRLEIYRHLLVGRDREDLRAPGRVIETANAYDMLVDNVSAHSCDLLSIRLCVRVDCLVDGDFVGRFTIKKNLCWE
jgi:hypothetical protein